MLLRSTFSTGVSVLFLLCLDFPSSTVQPTARLPSEIADCLKIRFTREMVDAIVMEIESEADKMLRSYRLMELILTDFDITSAYDDDGE